MNNKFKKQQSSNNGDYDEHIIKELIKFDIGTEEEIMEAMKNVINKNDINEIREFLIENQEKTNNMNDAVQNDNDIDDDSFSDDFDEDEELKENKCSAVSVQECGSLQRIKTILVEYQLINDKNDNDNDAEMEELINTHCKYLINDYHHILEEHLNENGDYNNSNNYHLIHEYIVSDIKCSISSCKQYKRNNRNRETEEKKINNSVDIKILIYQDILDTMHTFLVHSYDTGFRTKNIRKYDDGDNKDSDDPSKLDADDEMIKLKEHLDIKRKSLIRIRGQKRVQNNKFVTKFNQSSDSLMDAVNDNIDTDDNDDDKHDDDKQDDKTEIHEYSFGQRYYYWDHYKNLNEDDPDNPGYKYKDWYINKKYESLKSEILNELPINVYNQTQETAQCFLNNSNTIKKMKVDDRGNWGKLQWQQSVNIFAHRGTRRRLPYGIKEGELLTVSHLMSVVFYTNYTNLSYLFSSTFRRLSTTETNYAMQKRNSNYWNWSKLLRETVELWGDQLTNSERNPFDYQSWSSQIKKIPVLYHGTSYMQFNAFIAKFNSPTSMTRHLEVATIFANNTGLILEIEEYRGDFAFYFNCSLLSCYASEDERLFFGCYGCVQFKTIRNIATKQDYKYYIQALSLFNIVINGDDFMDDRKAKFVKQITWYTKIIKNLIKQKLKRKNNKYPKYINKLFNNFTEKQRFIKIELITLLNQYPSFKNIFLYSSNDSKDNIIGLLLLDNICNIFINCTHIEHGAFSVAHQKNYAVIDLTETYIARLINMLSSIHKNKLIKLKSITLRGVNFGGTAILSKYGSLFRQQNLKWKIEQIRKENTNRFWDINQTVGDIIIFKQSN